MTLIIGKNFCQHKRRRRSYLFQTPLGKLFFTWNRCHNLYYYQSSNLQLWLLIFQVYISEKITNTAVRLLNAISFSSRSDLGRLGFAHCEIDLDMLNKLHPSPSRCCSLAWVHLARLSSWQKLADRSNWGRDLSKWFSRSFRGIVSVSWQKLTSDDRWCSVRATRLAFVDFPLCARFAVRNAILDRKSPTSSGLLLLSPVSYWNTPIHLAILLYRIQPHPALFRTRWRRRDIYVLHFV